MMRTLLALLSVLLGFQYTPAGPVFPSSSLSPVAGMSLWFKADAIAGATNGSAITSWPDSSGNSHTATASSTGPIYNTGQLNGKPAVTFSGASSAMSITSPIAGSSGHTVFVVMQNTSTAAKGTIVGGAQFGFAYWTNTASSKQQGIDSQGIVQVGAGTASADTSWHQMNGAMTNAAQTFSISFRIGSASDATSASSSTSITANGPSTIGVSGVSAGEYLTAKVAEIIYYNSTLTLTQIQQNETYLLSKYGV